MRKVLLTCAVAMVALAAGCGGDDDESSSQAWANDFCSAAADWRSSIDDVVAQFQSPSDLSADSIKGAVDDGVAATDSFVDEVESLGPPETEASQEAADIVDSMTSAVQNTAADLRSMFSGDETLQELIAKAPQAVTELTGLESELQSSFLDLENLDTGELAGELESNEDCAAATSGS